ncbi:MAG: hypothetical protein Q9182_004813 [Xanthomendoza sp. 2 TL-2023]
MASTETSATEDSPNFFKRTNYDEDYWNNYLAARPDYSPSFYKSIYSYHQSHGGDFSTAHDIATGPGQVAHELSTHFNHVTASDVNTTHLDVAAHRLTPLLSSQKLKCVHSPAEDIASHHPPSSLDIITAAECFPLIDAPKALSAFSTVLKPNGTLAIWFYGRPIFTESEYQAPCQPLLNTILDRSFAPIIKNSGPQAKIGWKRGMDRMASFLDDIDFSPADWKSVERWKWNSEFPMLFSGPASCDFEVQTSSQVREGEKVEEVRDLGFWERKWDLAGVRRFVSVNVPTFDASVTAEGVEELYRELGEKMGGEGAVRKIGWPVVLILASRV